MSTQEEKLQAIAASLPAIAAGIDTLQAQVAELKEGNPDLNDEIAAIETTLATIAADLNPPAPEPEPEPTPEP